MSALACWLESEGLATVVIGLVRLHLEKVRPPRALWVPFELGRPLGPPQRPDFQRDVLLTALSLVQSNTSPAQIVDYEHDDPNVDDDQWQPPSLKSVSCIADEVRQLQPAHVAAVSRYGRTTTGVSKVAIDVAAEYVDSYLADKPMPLIRDDISASLSLRLALDDVRAFYTEAAGSQGYPSSRQLYDWFWFSTYAGIEIAGLRRRLLASGDEKLGLISEKFMVPRAFLRE